MSENAFALNSSYVINGIRQEFTPARILNALMERVDDSEEETGASIVDEIMDPEVRTSEPDGGDISGYLRGVLAAGRIIPLHCSGSYARCAVARALIDSLWKEGHFRLGNLLLKAAWSWNEKPVGAMAAFYESVEEAADYIDSLGLRLADYGYSRTEGENSVVFSALLDSGGDGYGESDESRAVVEPFRIPGAQMSERRICPSTFVPDPRSWVIYIPFDTAEFRLGGSLLAQTLGLGGSCPHIADAAYFIDCYEVVREFAEDGLLLSASTVGEGGLFTAAARMASEGTGVTLDISDMLRAYGGSGIAEILFSEIPGVLIQTRDPDFDYIDAELLLQDVAYFPLGHPVPGDGRVTVKASAKTKIQTILESLMQNAEGEY